MEKVPKREKLARCLMKYVGNPPIGEYIKYDLQYLKKWIVDKYTLTEKIKIYYNVDEICFMFSHLKSVKRDLIWKIQLLYHHQWRIILRLS